MKPMTTLSSFSFSKQEETKEDNGDIVVIFFTGKYKRGRGEGSLPSSSHFCHHLESPLAFTLLLPPH